MKSSMLYIAVSIFLINTKHQTVVFTSVWIYPPESPQQFRRLLTTVWTVNSELSWNTHIDTTAKKATQSPNFLRRNFSCCATAIRYLFYVITVCTTASASRTWTLSSRCDITQPELTPIWKKEINKPTYTLNLTPNKLPASFSGTVRWRQPNKLGISTYYGYFRFLMIIATSRLASWQLSATNSSITQWQPNKMRLRQNHPPNAMRYDTKVSKYLHFRNILDV